MSKRCMRCCKLVKHMELIQICNKCWENSNTCIDGGQHFCSYCGEHFDMDDGLKHVCKQCQKRSKGYRYCSEYDEDNTD